MIDVGRQLTLDINEDTVYSLFSTNNSMEVYTHTFFTWQAISASNSLQLTTTKMNKLYVWYLFYITVHNPIISTIPIGMHKLFDSAGFNYISPEEIQTRLPDENLGFIKFE